MDFNQAIEGSSSNNANKTELSGGAKINHLFSKQLPIEIAKIESMNLADEEMMRKEISFTVRNSNGIRAGQLSSDLAFEIIVKNRIPRLKEPSVKCLDLVVVELINVVRFCSEKVRHFQLAVHVLDLDTVLNLFIFCMSDETLSSTA